MNNYKIYCALAIIVFLSINIGCNTNDDLNTYSQPKPTIPDTVIFMSSFPTNVDLMLGKSVRIQNVNTTILFYSLLSDTRQIINNEVVGNAEIILHLDYGLFQKYVALNTNIVPSTYSLENGLQYSIHLKDVHRTDSLYHIVFQFNRYGDW